MRRLAAVLAAAGTLLLAPAASAAFYEVNSIAGADDAGINGDCDVDPTADDDCTLRAAIQESNASATADSIGFSTSNSGSDPDDVAFGPGAAPASVTISGGSGGLPTITDGVSISAGTCSTDIIDPTPEGVPCAVVGPIVIDSQGEVSITGLAFSTAGTGIDVVEVVGEDPNVPDFKLANSWFGIDTFAQKAVPPIVGVRLQDVDGAQIGSIDSFFERNIFARFGTGVDIVGADNTLLQRNLFGVLPDGSFARVDEGASHNGDAIEITGDSAPTPDDQAAGTQVGVASDFFAQTPECDATCNLIAASGQSTGNIPQGVDGIDLGGEAADDEIPALNTTIVGNQIGFSGGGLGVKGFNTTGIEIGGSASTTIGGSSPGARNVINGNEITSTSGAEQLVIEGNYVGLDQTGTSITADGSRTMLDLAGHGVVRGNFILSTPNQPALRLSGTGDGFLVDGNVFGENVAGDARGVGSPAIAVDSDGNVIGTADTGGANLISDLTVAPNSPSVGIRVTGDDNEIVGNRLGVGSAGDPRELLDGIVLSGDADGNIVGAPEFGENVISNVRGDAIVVSGSDSDSNLIARNRGENNGEEFIDLGDDGPGNLPDPDGPNSGAQPPVVTAVTETTATGTGVPHALVDVYSKADASAGEVASFLGETEVDNSGAWSLSLPAQAPGTLITATSTDEGTSELAAPLAVPGPPAPPPVADTDPPETSIAKRPRKRTKKRRAKFAFASDEAGARFECKLDKGSFAPCVSPLKRRVKPGKHVLSVRAVDAAGNADQTPAAARWKVKWRKR